MGKASSVASKASMARQVRAMLAFHRRGTPTFDYGNNIRAMARDAGEADAAATALFVAGPERWYATARSMGIKYVMLVDTEGRIHMNPAMRKRINLTNHESSPILLSQPL